MISGRATVGSLSPTTEWRLVPHGVFHITCFPCRREKSKPFNSSRGEHDVQVIQSIKETGPQVERHETRDNSLTAIPRFHDFYFTLISHMSRSVLDLGLQPTKRAKAQAIRRQRKSEDQTKGQAANQIESAQQLQLLLPPPSNPHAKPLGLQEIGLIFDQETQRMWQIDLRQRELPDGIRTRHQLSELHHELFRVNQYRILDRYWRRAGRTIIQKANAEEIARKYFRMRIYKRCKGWFQSEDSTIYLDGHTDLGYAKLQPQPRGTSGMPLNTVDFSNDEELSCAQSQSETMSVGPLETKYFSNGEGTTCAWCGAQSGSLPATLDSGYYEEQLQLGKTPITSLDTLRVSSDEEVRCAQLQPMRYLENLPDRINSDTPPPPTCAHFSFLTSIQRVTEQDQFHNLYTGYGNTFGDLCEQTSLPNPVGHVCC